MAEALEELLFGDYRGLAMHGLRTMVRAVAIAEGCGLDAVATAEIAIGAVLHDIGKLRLPTSLLGARRALSPGERRTMEQHPLLGVGILRAGAVSDMATSCIGLHHERWDGEGYPLGFPAGAMPIGARVVAIADVADTLLYDQPYRRALPGPEAVGQEILRCSGTQFDPALVDVALRSPLVLRAWGDRS